MDLRHRFTVPTTVEETWQHFADVESVAECFPGATVTSVTGDAFQGTCKVRLGPIALLYTGSGTFVERDEAAHRFVVEAKGKDKRGNGTAGATVTLSMADGGGQTDVEVLTDLSVTGKPAQFGRGVMQDVSDKLLGQFVACLERRLTGDPVDGSGSAPGAAGTAGATAVPDPSVPSASGASAPVTETPAEAPVPDPEAPPPAAADVPPSSRLQSSGTARADDALDLGTTVLPVVLKAYWKPAAVTLAALAFLLWWLLGRD